MQILNIKKNMLSTKMFLISTILLAGHLSLFSTQADQISDWIDGCGLNAVFDDCGGCEITCENKDVDVDTCPHDCVGACYCERGFVKSGGECISPEDCPEPCGPNEYYNPCGGCETTCENKDEEVRTCPPTCVAGCYCQAGFVNNDGLCTTPEECRSR